MGNIPAFENAFLDEIASSLRKRKKPISHIAAYLGCDKVYEVVKNNREEKLEITLDENTTGRSPGIRVYAWCDRSMWIDARALSAKGQKGWKWAWTVEGRLMPGFTGRDVVNALEQSASHLHGMDNSRTYRFEEIWRPLLARGLSVVG